MCRSDCWKIPEFLFHVKINTNAAKGINIFGTERAVYSSGASGTINIRTLNGDNRIIQSNGSSSLDSAVYASGNVNIESVSGDNWILAESSKSAVYASSKAQVNIGGVNNYFQGVVRSSSYSFYDDKATIVITGQNNDFQSSAIVDRAGAFTQYRPA